MLCDEMRFISRERPFRQPSKMLTAVLCFPSLRGVNKTWRRQRQNHFNGRFSDIYVVLLVSSFSPAFTFLWHFSKFRGDLFFSIFISYNFAYSSQFCFLMIYYVDFFYEFVFNNFFVLLLFLSFPCSISLFNILLFTFFHLKFSY